MKKQFIVTVETVACGTTPPDHVEEIVTEELRGYCYGLLQKGVIADYSVDPVEGDNDCCSRCDGGEQDPPDMMTLALRSTVATERIAETLAKMVSETPLPWPTWKHPRD